jgi:2,4-dienoyl-CoA reductase-like NADH-dependent reductase (Old Yellow Enzyme family)
VALDRERRRLARDCPERNPLQFDRPAPIALDQAAIDGIVASFEAAAGRVLEAGFKVVEIHAAHGYLLHEFLSPLANFRSDGYGGSLENRMRLPLRVAETVRARVPRGLPVFMRISATDWVKGGWDIQQSVEFATRAKERGIDLIDCSSGALVPDAKVPVGKGFQVPFAKRIRAEAKIKTAAVGMITDIAQADEIVIEGDADLVMIGRELLRQPYFALARMPRSAPSRAGLSNTVTRCSLAGSEARPRRASARSGQGFR